MKKLLFALFLSAGAGAQQLPSVVGDDVTHRVKAGENLLQIAERHGLALEHVAWANRLPEVLEVAPNTLLRIPQRRVLPAKPPQDGLVVNVPERGVYLFKDGKFVKFYPVAVGRAEPKKFQTPIGTFRITEKLKNPDWYAPKWAKLKTKVVKSGKKGNPLGDRWIGLSEPGLGFHVNVDPKSTGQALSHGCLRMGKSDIHDLFARVEPGMEVRIDYMPFRVGWQDGKQAVFAAFPDVYKRGTQLRAALEVLGQAGVGPALVNRPALERAIVARTGVPVQLAGTPVAVRNGGTAVLANGNLWVNTQQVREMGLKVAWEKPGRTLKISKGSKSKLFQLNQNDGVALFRGKVLVPLRAVQKQFAVQYQYHPKQKELVFADESD